MTAPIWFTCGYCYTTRLSDQPIHGDNPCPLKAEESKALVAQLEAQKSYFDRQAFAALDTSKGMESVIALMRSLTGQEDPDDD